MVDTTSDSKMLKCATWIMDISHFWMMTTKESVSSAGNKSAVRERIGANVVAELISLDKDDNPTVVASLQIIGTVIPAITSNHVVEVDKRHVVWYAKSESLKSTGGVIIIPENHKRFDVQTYLRGDESHKREDLKFSYSYHVEYEEKEPLEVPKSTQLEDYGAW